MGVAGSPNFTKALDEGCGQQATSTPAPMLRCPRGTPLRGPEKEEPRRDGQGCWLNLLLQKGKQSKKKTNTAREEKSADKKGQTKGEKAAKENR